MGSGCYVKMHPTWPVFNTRSNIKVSYGQKQLRVSPFTNCTCWSPARVENCTVFWEAFGQKQNTRRAEPFVNKMCNCFTPNFLVKFCKISLFPNFFLNKAKNKKNRKSHSLFRTTITVTQGRIQGRAIAPLKPTTVTLFTIILYNSESSIFDIRPFYLPLILHTSVVKYTSSLSQ